MAEYKIEVTLNAKADLSVFSAFERKYILEGIISHLRYEPLLATRNRKQMRFPRLGAWELRLGRYCVFYDVDENEKLVSIVAAGCKEHNLLYIRDKEIKL